MKNFSRNDEKVGESFRFLSFVSAFHKYDLFMRIDSNTKGHLQWYNFTIKNCGKKKIKLNIVNFKKAKTMYLRGMKPYVYSQFLKQAK